MKYVDACRSALQDMLFCEDNSLVCGQLVKYGTAGLTEGLHKRYPNQIITYPVSEALMNSSALGLALAGSRVVMIHERMDFVAVAMDALVNHIPLWHNKCGVALPLTIIGIVGKGNGQGPQHSKNLAHWFRDMEGWTVVEPNSPEQAANDMRMATSNNTPYFVALHREMFNSEQVFTVENRRIIGQCGASPRHEAEFYGR